MRILTRMLEMRQRDTYILWVYFVLGVLGGLFPALGVLSGIMLFALVFFRLQKQLSVGFPLIHITGVIATLQWVIGPILAYHFNFEAGRYWMRVESLEYFQYTIPATSAFLVGMELFGRSINQRRLLRQISSVDGLKIGLVLNAIALLAQVVGEFGPKSLAFAFLLLSQLRYVGILYLMLWRSHWRWPVLFACFAPLVINSTETAMFHNLLIWGGVVFCYWFALKRRSVQLKWGVFAIAALGAFTLQAVKGKFREKVWQGEEASLFDEMKSFWAEEGALQNENTLGNVIARLNQGWIVAAVMEHVPHREPFARGETIREAITSSLLPRFLSPDKAGGGGRSNFLRFTGLSLNEGTAMGVSPVGEAFGNFGLLGGIVTMFLYGSLFGLLTTSCFLYASRHPDFVFWIPLVFYQAIKAESDFVTILNQLTKGGILAFGAYWLVSYSLGIREKRSMKPSQKQAYGLHKNAGTAKTVGWQDGERVHIGNERPDIEDK